MAQRRRPAISPLAATLTPTTQQRTYPFFDLTRAAKAARQPLLNGAGFSDWIGRFH